MKNDFDANAAYASGECMWRQQEQELQLQRLSEEQSMGFRDMYAGNSKHLKGVDIKGHGDVPVVIDRWEQVDFNEGPKLVIGFKNKDKTVVLNKTNYETIADAYGDHPDGWIGKGLTLFTMKVEFNGQMVDAIRMRISTPTPRQEAPPPPTHEPMTTDADLDDDIPF